MSCLNVTIKVLEGTPKEEPVPSCSPSMSVSLIKMTSASMDIQRLGHFSVRLSKFCDTSSVSMYIQRLGHFRARLSVFCDTSLDARLYASDALLIPIDAPYFIVARDGRL